MYSVTVFMTSLVIGPRILLKKNMCRTYFGWYYSTIKQMKNVKTIMRNDFKMTVFKQLTISIKTQNDNKIKVSCSANQQNVTLHVKHDHQYRRDFKYLNIIWCIVCFFLHLLRRLIFFQEIRPPFSMLNAKRFEIVYVLHHLYIMYSNVKTPSDVT
jgi:hypothetical protein